jgi:probable F420-dependent oxidoreductase
MQLGRVGIYSTELRFGQPDETAASARELEDLGFTALWIPGAFGGPVFEVVRLALDATRHVTVATGIVNIWAHSPAEVAEACVGIADDHPGRFLLGLGASHAEFASALGADRNEFAKPFTKMTSYLDALDLEARPVAVGGRALAALGPRMRGLAVDRSAGIHSYFVTAEHTRLAREQAGPEALIAVEHAVVLEESPEVAREIARNYTAVYATLPNYSRNLETFGFTAADFEGGGSDRLVDDVVAWGSEEQIRERLADHLRAGADHVCVQVITADWDARKLVAGDGVRQPRAEWRKLADLTTSLNSENTFSGHRA